MSKKSTLQKICVVGAGQLGTGIAQVFACAGFNHVSLVDTSTIQLSKSIDTISRSLANLYKKNKIQSADDPHTIINRIVATSDSEVMKIADLIIEAVPEIEGLKHSIFQLADKIAPKHAILASNTSSLSITKLGCKATSRPDKVIGLHFMNPAPMMPLVEIIRGLETSDETFKTAVELVEILGKQFCVSVDRPGFIVNRLLMPQINEAFFALMEGVATANDIDIGMKLGCNHPMGPLSLADLIGLDTCLAVLRVLHANLGDKYSPCPLLVQYVDAGWLGRKSGRGVMGVYK